MDTTKKQSIDQNIRKLAETASFSDLYRQGYGGSLKYISLKDNIYLNGEKYRPQSISTHNIFSLLIIEIEWI